MSRSVGEARTIKGNMFRSLRDTHRSSVKPKTKINYSRKKLKTTKFRLGFSFGQINSYVTEKRFAFTVYEEKAMSLL